MSTPVSPSAGSPLTPNRVAAKNDNNPIWFDMKITGPSPENGHAIEVAVMMTDSEPNILAEGPVLAVHQSDELLGGMGAWNKDTYDRSDLIDKVKTSTMTEAEAEVGLLAFLREWVPKSKSPVCGNPICQDRRFMAYCIPESGGYFHYRNLDVSTLKELCKRWWPTAVKDFTEYQRYMAFTDIIESTEELRYYRECFIRDVPQTPDAEALMSSAAP